jgi:ribosomal protein S18 acetylase RimI-like enzyme
MIVREARAEDAISIAKVHVDSWRTAYRDIIANTYLEALSYDDREHYWQSLLERPERTTLVYVAEDDDGEIVGFASGGPEREGNPTYKGEVFAIYILQQAQRRGIGRQLTAAIVQSLVQQGIESMLIWVLADNPARKFYEALGGQYLQEKPIEIGGVKLLEVAYGWTNIRPLANSKNANG